VKSNPSTSRQRVGSKIALTAAVPMPVSLIGPSRPAARQSRSPGFPWSASPTARINFHCEADRRGCGT
jgi:hypothetical protein